MNDRRRMSPTWRLAQAVAVLGAVGVVVLLVQLLFRFRPLNGVATAAALAAGIYYWFTVPSVIGATEAMWGLAPTPGWVEPTAQVVVLALVAAWLATVPRRRRRRVTHAHAHAGAPA